MEEFILLLAQAPNLEIMLDSSLSLPQPISSLSVNPVGFTFKRDPESDHSWTPSLPPTPDPGG